MADDPIANQIDDIGVGHMAGCAMKFVIVLVVGSVVLGLVVKHTKDAGVILCFALGMAGLLFGFFATALASAARRFLTGVFVLLPLVASLLMFAYRTLFGRAEELPMRLVAAPLLLSLGFLIGRGRPRY